MHLYIKVVPQRMKKNRFFRSNTYNENCGFHRLLAIATISSELKAITLIS